MELKEMIKVMQHYDNGGEVEVKRTIQHDINWAKSLANPVWNWDTFDYRIKEEKQKITIEKWLCLDKQGGFVIIETSNIEEYRYITEKVKLIESYEVEL